MKMRFFDFEVTPNWWLCVFGDLPNSEYDESIKNTFTWVSSDMYNARDKLLNMLREENYVMCGYNIKGYDLIIANAIYQGFSPQQVHIISDIIINPSLAYSTKEHLRLQSFAKRRISGICYQDLMDDNDGTLKEKEAILGLNILESSVDFNKEDLTVADKEDMLYYCKQDVYASMVYCDKIMHTYIATKLAIGRKFGIPERECYMCTNAKLVAKALGAVHTQFLDEDKIEIDLPIKIRDYCYENLPSNIVDKLRTSKDAFTVRLFDNDVSFGNGGIHSVYANNIYVEASEDWILLNVDASSYYPSMLIQFNCLSRAVKRPEIFTEIFEERIKLKNKPNRTPEEDDIQKADKLVLNTTYGASGNQYLELYDPYMCSRCCRLGQIFLAALANKLVYSINGLKVIQTNTDGILIYCRRKDLDKVKMLQAEWTKVSGINMEFDYVSKIWQRDVNNYVLVKEDGKIKRKGLWLLDDYHKPGTIKLGPLTAFVCQKAVIDYLVRDKDILQSIINNTNLSDFVLTCKKGPTFRGVVQRLGNGMEIPLYKCNRVYASKDASLGQIFKVKMNKGTLSYTTMTGVPAHCRLVNEALHTYSFSDIKKDIDYMFYLERCCDLLDIPWIEIDGLDIHKTNRFNYFNI